MVSERHVSDRLGDLIEGRLDAAQAEEVGSHLAACPACAEERDLLREGKALFSPLARVEPRTGFAYQVAAAAAEQARPHAVWSWRWALGGTAAAAVAASVVFAVLPKTVSDGQGSHEMMLAQRLELYEDLSVMQNREALENLDVVEQLDKLELGKP